MLYRPTWALFYYLCYSVSSGLQDANKELVHVFYLCPKHKIYGTTNLLPSRMDLWKI